MVSYGIFPQIGTVSSANYFHNPVLVRGDPRPGWKLGRTIDTLTGTRPEDGVEDVALISG